MNYNTFLTLVIIGHSLWYLMVYILKENEYESSWFMLNISDFSQMVKLIRSESNPTKKRGYIILLVLTGSFFVAMLVYIIHFLMRLM